MASRSARGRRASQDSAFLLSMRTPERQRRSLSQGDDTPRPSGVLQGSAVPTTTSGSSSSNTAPMAQSHISDNNLAPSIFHAGTEHGTSKRLGFLGEKLLSSSNSGLSASTLRGTPVSQLLPRSHSRADSANLLGLSRESTASPAPSSMSTSPSQFAKGHTSPSKVSVFPVFDTVQSRATRYVVMEEAESMSGSCAGRVP